MKNNIESQIKAKPFLKWAGGKGQLLEQFAGFYPAGLKNREIEHFYEPFIGGGAVFFDVAQRYQIKSAGLYDINDELILTYKVVQEEVDSLIEQLDKLKRRYEKLNEAGQKEFYYGIRQDFNDNKSRVDFNRYSKKWVVRAAQIIFLNRTCFNGLFRFNSKGEFNVPQGSYKNPKILDGKNLQKASEILQIAEIKQGDFKQVEKDMKDHSFVYFDPPYRPISKTSGFTSYSANPFGDKEQIELSGLFHRLHKKGAKLMLSNSDPKHTDPEDNFFDDIYKDYHLSRVPAKRIINSDASKRQEINEIIVTNYPVF